jgi:hypothetical protein
MENLHRLLICLFFAGSITRISAQNADSTHSPLTFSGYAEAYYLYDSNNPSDHNRPGFVYSHNRHNEVNINLGFLKVNYDQERVRGNLALMTGTYSNANLAAEPGVLKNIFEANVGVKISQKHNLWVDAGIMPSHIGFESAIGKDCWNMSRSMAADNSPYFETGAKITWTDADGRWTLSGLLLNGWQRIQRPEANNTPAFGHQITFKPNARVTLNSSSFIGNDFPDAARRMRYFHNIYGIFQVSDALGLTLGFDVGAQQAARNSSDYDYWYTPVAIARLNMSAKTTIAARAEYYADRNGVIIATNTPEGFSTWGYSLNVDYQISPNVLWRVEGRGFTTQTALFSLRNEPSRHNFFVGTSLSVGL